MQDQRKGFEAGAQIIGIIGFFFHLGEACADEMAEFIRVQPGSADIVFVGRDRVPAPFHIDPA